MEEINKLYVNVEAVESAIKEINFDFYQEQIDTAFNDISKFNENWYDDDNTEKFKNIVLNYQSSLNAFMYEIKQLVGNIEKEMEKYTEIESVGKKW